MQIPVINEFAAMVLQDFIAQIEAYESNPDFDANETACRVRSCLDEAYSKGFDRKLIKCIVAARKGEKADFSAFDERHANMYLRAMQMKLNRAAVIDKALYG